MNESSSPKPLEKRDVGLIWVLVIALALALFFFLPDSLNGIKDRLFATMGLTFGSLALASALFLKAGKVRPGTSWAGETVQGMVLLSLGMLGFGLDYLISGLAEGASSGIRLPTLVEVVLLLMILCLPFGLVVEWKARKQRRSKGSGGN
jgi:hypothetical protein